MPFCPKCGRYSFEYDPYVKANRCFAVDCFVFDLKNELKLNQSEEFLAQKIIDEIKRKIIL